MTKRINLISGPRNISTALMYSFASRPDTTVVDEPMYAYYLNHTSIDYHPGTDEILSTLPTDLKEVQENYIFREVDTPVYFIKGMAHHYIDVDLSFLNRLVNIFLIRDPYQLITSFANVIESPTLLDIGLEHEWKICQYLLKENQIPIVLDANELLLDPDAYLSRLCKVIDLPYDISMLSWDKGPIAQDGCWAKYWYKNVWQSTGFIQPKPSRGVLPRTLEGLYEESLVFYDLLSNYKL